MILSIFLATFAKLFLFSFLATLFLFLLPSLSWFFFVFFGLPLSCYFLRATITKLGLFLVTVAKPFCCFLTGILSVQLLALLLSHGAVSIQ